MNENKVPRRKVEFDEDFARKRFEHVDKFIKKFGRTPTKDNEGVCPVCRQATDNLIIDLLNKAEYCPDCAQRGFKYIRERLNNEQR